MIFSEYFCTEVLPKSTPFKPKLGAPKTPKKVKGAPNFHLQSFGPLLFSFARCISGTVVRTFGNMPRSCQEFSELSKVVGCI